MYNPDIFRTLVHSEPQEYSETLRHCKSLKYSIHRTLCNFGKFTTLAYSNLSILRTQRIWWAVLCRTLCNTDIFRTRGTFRTLSKIYYGEFYSEPYVTLVHLKKPWRIQNRRHINIINNLDQKPHYETMNVTWSNSLGK